MKEYNIALVLPCFNPIPGWQDTVITSFKNIQKMSEGFSLSLCIVNDGSKKNFKTTDFEKISEEIPNSQLISYSINKGKGHALRTGLEKTSYDFYIYTDIDFPYEDKDTALLITRIAKKEADIIPGIRNESYEINAPKIRIYISRILKKFIKYLLRLEVYDTQCGLKAFNNKGKAHFLSTKINRYLFDLEFIYFASKDRKIKISPQVVTLKEGIVFSKMNSKMLLQESVNFLKVFLSRSLFKN